MSPRSASHTGALQPRSFISKLVSPFVERDCRCVIDTTNLCNVADNDACYRFSKMQHRLVRYVVTTVPPNRSIIQVLEVQQDSRHESAILTVK